jgi:hypothetical protein
MAEVIAARVTPLPGHDFGPSRMTALGPLVDLPARAPMSAGGSKADMSSGLVEVCFCPEADITRFIALS